MRKTSSTYNSFKWYGFDLDGTIADNTNHAFGYGNIGKPIKRMTSLMKRLNARGFRVKIVTARLGDVGSCPKAQDELRQHIWEWCDKNLGFRPEITDRKDASMEVLYDDRARQVIRNQGEDMQNVAGEIAIALDSLIESRGNLKNAISVRDKCKRLGLL
ncbi:MAG: hypothetical protein J6Q22_09720 [Prevotella sp.]|nr:hypothetical protein [Prevotella sp.]